MKESLGKQYNRVQAAALGLTGIAKPSKLITISPCCWVCESLYLCPGHDGEVFVGRTEVWCKSEEAGTNKEIEDPLTHNCPSFNLKKELCND